MTHTRLQLHNLRLAYRKWLKACPVKNRVAVTLTLRRRVDGEWVTKEAAEQNFRHFLNLLNRLAFGSGGRRAGKRLVVIPVLEATQDGRLHYHGLFGRPSHVGPTEFAGAIRSCWARTRWAYHQMDVKVGADDGWLAYLLKARSKLEPDEIIDLANLHTC